MMFSYVVFETQIYIIYKNLIFLQNHTNIKKLQILWIVTKIKGCKFSIDRTKILSNFNGGFNQHRTVLQIITWFNLKQLVRESNIFNVE